MNMLSDQTAFISIIALVTIQLVCKLCENLALRVWLFIAIILGFIFVLGFSADGLFWQVIFWVGFFARLLGYLINLKKSKDFKPYLLRYAPVTGAVLYILSLLGRMSQNQGILEFPKLAQCFQLAAAVKSKEIAPSQ